MEQAELPADRRDSITLSSIVFIGETTDGVGWNSLSTDRRILLRFEISRETANRVIVYLPLMCSTLICQPCDRGRDCIFVHEDDFF